MAVVVVNSAGSPPVWRRVRVSFESVTFVNLMLLLIAHDVRGLVGLDQNRLDAMLLVNRVMLLEI